MPEQLRQRLAALGVTALALGPEGRATPLGPCRGLERLVLTAPLFAAAARAAWTDGAHPAGPVLAVWPGLWLAPLPVPAGPRVRGASPLRTAVLLLGPELLASDQLRAICDYHRVDFQATVAAADPAALLAPAAASRLGAALVWLAQDAADHERSGGEVGTLSAHLAEAYEELSLLYKFSNSMTVDQPPAQLLTEACLELQQTVGLRWMALQLTDEPRLHELAGRVFAAGAVGGNPATLTRIGLQLMQLRGGDGAPLVVDDTASLRIPGLDALAQTLLVVSLLREERHLGVLFGGDKLDGKQISTIDSKLCNSLANSLSIFLDNTMLYEDMQAMFIGTLHALTSAIDAKDSYTHGHSERVATVSRLLAQAAGFDAAQVERVYLSGLVHDVGKIGVPEAVLRKAGKLTDEEFALIKMHPEIGAHILADIRQMQDLIPGVLCHHERWDGKGYPRGLAGEAIPPFGRLICLADSFDAMSSNRTYRASLPHQTVLDEIRRCTGAQFDPRLAEVFVALDFAPFFAQYEKNKQQPATAA
jgi:HD-GYP domain-containing protein (c-di-GMP phosphodiesterase class II)